MFDEIITKVASGEFDAGRQVVDPIAWPAAGGQLHSAWPLNKLQMICGLPPMSYGFQLNLIPPFPPC